MPGSGNRSLTIGPYLQYFRDDLKKGQRLEGLEIRDLEAVGDELWAATNEGIYNLAGGSWRKESIEAEAHCLSLHPNGSLIAGCTGQAYIRDKGAWAPLGGSLEGRAPKAIVVGPDGRMWLGTERGLGVLEGNRWRWFQGTEGLMVRSLACPNGRVMAGTDKGIWVHEEDGWVNMTAKSGPRGLLSRDVRMLVASEMGNVWICSAGGLSIFDGHDYYHSFTGADGLPYQDAQCLVLDRSRNVWVGCSIGLCELREGRWHYYVGRRWIPNDDVRSLAVASDDSIWIGTADGLSRIYGRWISLEQKAKMIGEIVRQRHERDGYIEFISLPAPGDFSSWTYEASDNDGLWTSIYLAAESFRYAVTGDPEAKANAKQSYEALKRLEHLTGISGFPARAAVRKDSVNVAKSGGEWHLSSVDPSWEWKGDTSSDEIDGHYFAYAIYYDLVADEAEKKDVAALVTRITDHIIDNGFYLVDLDGKRTTWGVWNPKEINDDPRWSEEHGLNALEILSHLKVAIRMTNLDRFREAYNSLIHDHHYHLNTIEQKIVPPGHVNHSDDELAFLAYYPLMLYEDDSYLRSVYLMSIERSWQIERPERSPFFNFVYGAATGADFDLEESVEELKGMSPDLVDWLVPSGHRSDVQARLAAGELFTLTFEDRNMMRWNANPYRFDWGGGGRTEGDGAYFLMPYWMGRYHGFIVEGA